MAERYRSRDGRKETEEILGEDGTVSEAGRSGTDMARRIATRDELKRAKERPAGATRVTGEEKSEED